jgi:hypothetical protein
MSLWNRSKDPYIERWKKRVARPGGLMPASGLRLRERGSEQAVYDIETGVVVWNALAAKRWAIASSLEVEEERLWLKVHPTRPRRAQLIILEGELYGPAPRFVEDVEVEGETIGGLGHYVDGRELQVTMQEPLALVGGYQTGKATAARRLAVSALSTGRRQLLLVDPRETSSPALRAAARVALVGEEAAQHAGAVLEALVSGRAAAAKRHGLELSTPTAEQAGWVVVLDDLHKIVDQFGDVTRQWSLRRCTSLGLWPVAVHRSARDAFWGTPAVWAIFSGQVHQFQRTDVELGPNPLLHMQDLPTNGQGRPLPGYVIPAGLGAEGLPALWRWLPGDEQLETEPPLRLDEALAQFARQPALPAFDLASLTGAMGDPVGGRWEIGPQGTHTVPAAAMPQGRTVADVRDDVGNRPQGSSSR